MQAQSTLRATERHRARSWYILARLANATVSSHRTKLAIANETSVPSLARAQ